MKVTLNPELERRVNEKLQRSEFASADALIAEALRRFLEEDEEEFRQTRAAIDEALEQSQQGKTIPLKEFDQDMRRKHGIPR